jgi:MATE family multidrug resistance protein
MSTVAFTAQAVGARDATEIRATLARAIFLAAAIGIILIAIHAPLGSAILTLMGGSEAVTSAAHTYFTIRIWSAPLVLANYVVLGWLVGQARTTIALALQVLINVTNMIVTAWLVLEMDTGIAGAAIAAVFAEFIGFVAGGVIAWRGLSGQIGVSARLLFDRDKLLHMFAVNRDIMIRTAALIAAFLFFTAQGARAGDDTLAANAVLNNFILVGSFFLDGFATAAEQLCGRSVGARDRTGFEQAMRLVLAWGFAFGVAVTVILAFAGGPLIDLITTSAEVRIAAREFMWLAALAPVCGVMAYAFDGIYIGATWAAAMRNLMIASFAIYLAVWWLLTPFGNHGLWLALLAFLMARGLLQALRCPALMRATFGDAPSPALRPASPPP